MNATAAVTRPFLDPAAPPAPEALRTTLGGAHERYAAIASLAAGFEHDWTFSKSSGWLLKVHRRGKALLYVIPFDGRFAVSLALRSNERDGLGGDADLGPLCEKILAAKKYSEGFALRFEITPELPAPEFDLLSLFLTRLIAMRA